MIPAPLDPVHQSKFWHPRRPAFTPDGRGLLFRAARKLALADRAGQPTADSGAVNAVTIVPNLDKVAVVAQSDAVHGLPPVLWPAKDAQQDAQADGEQARQEAHLLLLHQPDVVDRAVGRVHVPEAQRGDGPAHHQQAAD